MYIYLPSEHKNKHMLYAVINKHTQTVSIYESSKINILSQAGMAAYVREQEGLSNVAFHATYKIEFLGREIERLSKKYTKYTLIHK